MICQYCKHRYADFPDEDYIKDVPAPPGKGFIARSKEAHKRRMKIYWNNEVGDCGCNAQEECYLRGDE